MRYPDNCRTNSVTMELLIAFFTWSISTAPTRYALPVFLLLPPTAVFNIDAIRSIPSRVKLPCRSIRAVSITTSLKIN